MSVVWIDPVNTSFDQIALTGELVVDTMLDIPSPTFEPHLDLMVRVFSGVQRAANRIAELETMRFAGAGRREVRAAVIDSLVSASTVYLPCSRPSFSELSVTYLAANIPYLRAHAAAELGQGVVDGPASKMYAQVEHQIEASGGVDPTARFETIDELVNQAVMLYEMERRESAQALSETLDANDLPVVPAPFDDLAVLLDEDSGEITVNLEFLSEFTRWAFSKWAYCSISMCESSS